MTTSQAPSHRLGRAAGRPPSRERRSYLSYLPAAAGIAYLGAWVAGLAAWPTNLALNATAVQAARSFRHSAGPATAQVLLVEGIAGVLLGIVLASLLAAGSLRDAEARPGPRGRRGGWRAAALLGATAVAVSLGQCVVGLLLVAAADHQEIARSGALYDLLNRLDGVKMIALALAAIYLAARRGGAGLLQPRWLQVTAVLLAVSLAASSLAYLLLWNALAWTAYASGPLLLFWVTAAGIWLTRHRGESGAEYAD